MSLWLAAVGVVACIATAVVLDGIRHLKRLPKWADELRTPGWDRTIRFGFYVAGGGALFVLFYLFVVSGHSAHSLLVRLGFALVVALFAIPEIVSDVRKMHHRHRLSRFRVYRS